MIKLKGIINTSLGGFMCMRGFSTLGELASISQVDQSYQRKVDAGHKKELKQFLNDKQNLFFPEIILGTHLANDKPSSSDTESTFVDIAQQIILKDVGRFTLKLDLFDVVMPATRKYRNGRYAEIIIDDSKTDFIKFDRIDGNHRLEALSYSGVDGSINDLITPFCLMLFDSNNNLSKNCKALFHNINFKQLPLTMEDNLKLILDDQDSFSDDDLKNQPAYGIEYYFARKVMGKLDPELLHFIQKPLKGYEKTFLVETFKLLLGMNILTDSDNSVKRFKQAISKINSVYERYQELQNSTNAGLLGAFVYYQLKPEKLCSSFCRWVLDNHIFSIKNSNTKDIIDIYDKILESKNREIFVSMPFGKDETEDHYDIIERVVKEINEIHNLKVKIKARRVDWFVDGTSYDINSKILDMIDDCGLLLADLTFCNPNVYHEIGFMMGKARQAGEVLGNFVLYLDESADREYKVGFNLSSIKQIRFKRSEEFVKELKKHIITFYNLSK